MDIKARIKGSPHNIFSLLILNHVNGNRNIINAFVHRKLASCKAPKASVSSLN